MRLLLLLVPVAFVALLLWVAFVAVRALWQGYAARERERRTSPPRGGLLVRDPVCGLALPQERALFEDGQYFCSEACRARFRRAG
jgi:hypothetical protein